MVHIISELIPIAVFAAVVLIIYFIAKFQYETKKAILDKGGNIEVPKTKFKNPFLEIGLVLLGVGLGLGISVIFSLTDLSEDAKDMLTGTFILLFGGAGLVSAFFIRRNLEKSDK